MVSQGIIDAMEHPVPGVIADLQAKPKRYLVAPDYWPYWGKSRPTAPFEGKGAVTLTQIPPAKGWAQPLWRKKENLDRLVRRQVGKEKDCIPSPGTTKPNQAKDAKWWYWLEDSRDPISPRIRKTGGFVGEFIGNALNAIMGKGCPRTEVRVAPAAGSWVRYGPYKYNPMHPILESQHVWMIQNSMRRPTMEGYPEALAPWGIRNVSPRRSRNEGGIPATLDPALPRPARPLPFDVGDKGEMKVYTGPESKMLSMVAEAGTGKRPPMPADMKLEGLALARAIRMNPNFVEDYYKNPPDPEDFLGKMKPPGASGPEWQDRPEKPWAPPKHEDLGVQLEHRWQNEIRKLGTREYARGDAGVAGKKTGDTISDLWAAEFGRLPERPLTAKEMIQNLKERILPIAKGQVGVGEASGAAGLPLKTGGICASAGGEPLNGSTLAAIHAISASTGARRRQGGAKAHEDTAVAHRKHQMLAKAAAFV